MKREDIQKLKKLPFQQGESQVYKKKFYEDDI